MRFKTFCVVVMPVLIIFNASVFAQSFNSSCLKLKDIKNSYSPNIDTTAQKQIKEEKSAFVAGTLSLIGPGLAFGQLYNGQPEKFFLHLSISTACITGVYISGMTGVSSHGTGPAILLIGAAFIYLGNWVWSIIDAANSADEINRQAANKKQHSDILNKLKFGLTINKNKQFNLKFALEL